MHGQKALTRMTIPHYKNEMKNAHAHGYLLQNEMK